MPNGNGRKPDFNVTIPRNYEVGEDQRTHWYTIGEAWHGENGNIIIKVAFYPGVNFVLCPRKDDEQEPTLIPPEKNEKKRR